MSTWELVGVLCLFGCIAILTWQTWRLRRDVEALEAKVVKLADLSGRGFELTARGLAAQENVTPER